MTYHEKEDEMDEAVTKLIEFLQTASPVIWAVLVKQVYVDAIANLVWATALILATVFTYNQGAKLWNRNDDMDQPLSLMLWIVAGICGLIGMICLTEAITHFLNPEFYAIQYILLKIGS